MDGSVKQNKYRSLFHIRDEGLFQVLLGSLLGQIMILLIIFTEKVAKRINTNRLKRVKTKHLCIGINYIL